MNIRGICDDCIHSKVCWLDGMIQACRDKETERTCTMKYEFEDSKYYDGFEVYPVSGVECSKCKEIIYDCNTLNYCPNCGARVEEVE